MNDLVPQPSLDQVVPIDANSDIDALRQSAANNHPEAQRELAKRLLFGDGVPADPAESIHWARRAALNGDELAALWTGRVALNEPIDRIEAGAWFMIAQQAQEAFVREDATGEMEALNLTEYEWNRALERATELKQIILIGSE
ncbi:tetratricopeptide repeat protein [Coraliomargarita sp. W4R53]